MIFYKIRWSGKSILALEPKFHRDWCKNGHATREKSDSNLKSEQALGQLFYKNSLKSLVIMLRTGRNTSIWVLTSFRFMSSFAFLNFFVGLTSLDFELFWCLMLFVLFCCLMLFVLFCCLTSLVLCTLSKKCVRLLTFFIGTFSSLSTFAFKFILSLYFVFSWNYFRYC